MDIDEILKKMFGDDPEAILKGKTEGDQYRDYIQREAPALVKMTSEECKSICKTTGIEYKAGYEGRVLSYVCSDASVDRMGDVIKQDGWDLKNFKTNPVVMANHDYAKFPVGNAIKVGVQDGKLKMDVLFPDKEVSEDSDKAFKLAKAGVMRAGSVGFIPLKHHRPSDEEKEALGMESEWGTIFDKQELLEWSVCGVPANANALQESIRKGLFKKKDFKKFVPESIYKDLQDTENKQAGTGTTSETDDHKHSFEVDDEGSGDTGEADGHSHTITNFILNEKNEHVHTINIKSGHEDNPKKPKKPKKTNEQITPTLEMFGETFKALMDKEIDARIEKRIEEKQGAVLSKKNKTMITDAIEGMSKAVDALKTLVLEANPEEEFEEKPDKEKTIEGESTVDIDLDTLDDSGDEGLYAGETIFELKI